MYYTDNSNNIQIVQYRRARGNPNVADAHSARTVLTIDHHTETNHNGGQLQFGPDGDLYIGVGDGGSEGDPHNYGQNTSLLLGKLLRISPRPAGGYTIPPGNRCAPGSRRRPEIWAYGLRNPWRFSFDRSTGDLIIGDVGQDTEEEVDFARRGHGAGANYGWSIFEGDRRYKPRSAPGAIRPALVTLHRNGYCAIIGGYVVRDRSLRSLYGRYLFGDSCKAQINSVLVSAATPARTVRPACRSAAYRPLARTTPGTSTLSRLPVPYTGSSSAEAVRSATGTRGRQRESRYRAAGPTLPLLSSSSRARANGVSAGLTKGPGTSVPAAATSTSA